MNIAITGHIPNKSGNDYNLTSPLIEEIKKRIMDILEYMVYSEAPKPVTLITGMSFIDTLFAQIAIAMNIPFIAAIPFIGQYSKWNNELQRRYLYLLSRATNIQLVSDNCNLTYDLYLDKYDLYSYKRVDFLGARIDNVSAEMQKRDKWMVDNADMLISVWDGSNGGTANYIEYANTQLNVGRLKRIVNIDPKLLTPGYIAYQNH